MFVERPLIERLHRARGGAPAGFGGNVSMPGQGMEPMMPMVQQFVADFDEAPPMPQPEPLLSRLLNLQPECPMLKERLDDVIARLSPLVAEVGALEEKIEEEHQTILENRLSEVGIWLDSSSSTLI